MLVNPVARLSQNFGPLVLSHAAEGNQSFPKSKPPFNQGLFQIPAQSPKNKVSLIVSESPDFALLNSVTIGASEIGSNPKP